MKGLLGGTFDPPHIGHLILALEAAARFSLAEVLLVPSRLPPHKPAGSLSSFVHRLRMTELAASTSPVLRAADLEPAGAPSWTADLLARLKASGEDVCFIMGMDSLLELPAWKDPRRILGSATVVAGTRPGFDPSAVPADLLDRVRIFAIPDVRISSTELRRRFALGLPTRYLVTEAVRDYVEGNGLYAGTEGD